MKGILMQPQIGPHFANLNLISLSSLCHFPFTYCRSLPPILPPADVFILFYHTLLPRLFILFSVFF